MITLKTLPSATAQEVFDQVAIHLLTQNRRSYIKGAGCVYRNGDTPPLKCAAGCLIADDELHMVSELRKWSSLVRTRAVPAEHYELIAKLQRVHDMHPEFAWRGVLYEVAGEYRLNTKAIERFSNENV